MLLITLELISGREIGRRKMLGQMAITNSGGDAAYGSYMVEVREFPDKPTLTALLNDYPRFAASPWDLVARGLATALSNGREELPPRPVHAWRQEGSED
jgi:hypothetical protein